MKYSKPQAVEIMHYSKIVETSIQDFQTNAYTDYKAHVNNFLINAQSVQCHKKPTNVNDLKKKRLHIEEYTPDEIRQMEKEQEIEELLNWDFDQKVREYDAKVAGHYRKTNKLMIE